MYMFIYLLDKTGEELWTSVTSVSAAGAKKGRGKRVGRKKMTDLNRGQVLGTGERYSSDMCIRIKVMYISASSSLNIVFVNVDCYVHNLDQTVLFLAICNSC